MTIELVHVEDQGEYDRSSCLCSSNCLPRSWHRCLLCNVFTATVLFERLSVVVVSSYENRSDVDEMIGDMRRFTTERITWLQHTVKP